MAFLLFWSNFLHDDMGYIIELYLIFSSEENSGALQEIVNDIRQIK